MFGVAESGRSGLLYLIGNVPYRVACSAGIDSESFFAIVASAAGFTLLHVSHGKSFVGTSCEYCRVAGTAVRMFGAMCLVAEYGWPCCSDLENNLFCRVASAAFAD